MSKVLLALVALRVINPQLPSSHLLGGLESSSRSPSRFRTVLFIISTGLVRQTCLLTTRRWLPGLFH